MMARALLAMLSGGIVVVGGTTTTTTQSLGLPQWDEITAQDENVSAVEKLDVLDASTWTVPARVGFCPVHQPAQIAVTDGNVEIDTTLNQSVIYSIVEGQLPQAALSSDLSKYDGLEMAFSNSKVSHFKVRLSDSRQEVRFIAAVKVNNDGPHNLWLKWSDFHGEELMMRGLRPCEETSACRNIMPATLSSIAVLLPISSEEAPAKFTIQRLTLDILQRGGQNATDSTDLRPSSEAQEIWFETTNANSMISFAQNLNLGVWSMLSVLSFMSMA
ncbi:unnamed protein product [Durusdinium trenchii]|uniref:Uncharacterized protein n=1 Tax=Durusdinium trenchii TaxID=1381693 RepID=A0ABP0NYW5_9DINO